MNDDSTDPDIGNNPYPTYAGDSVKLDQAMKRIAKSILDGTVEFVLGAGISEESQVPLGRRLAVKLLGEYFPVEAESPSLEQLTDLARDYPLEAIATAVEAMPGKKRMDLTEILKSALFGEGGGPSESHTLLLSLCFWDGDQRVRRLFTTNFDTFIEDVIKGKGVSVGFKDDEKIRNAERNSLVPIIHLHGKLDEEYHITESDLFREMPNLMHSRFLAALNEADAFVFIGYSLSDPDFRSVYMKYREQIQLRHGNGENKDKTTYVVAPPNNKYHYQLGECIWSARGVVWIPLTACAFFKRLRSFLEHKLGTEELKDLQRKYRIEDSKAFSDKVDRVARILCLEKEETLKFMMDARMSSGGDR